MDLQIRRDIRISGIYSPTDNSDLNIKANFFDRLSDKIIKTKKEIILLRYLKGRSGKTFDSKITGRDGEEVVKDSGTRWIGKWILPT